MQLEASINTTQLETNPQPGVAVAENNTVSEIDHKTPERFDGKLDEFDDLDDDFFDEAENLITADSQQVSQAPAATELDDLDDEFGDAFGGDFDFEAVELAATQAAQNCSGDVRRTT